MSRPTTLQKAAAALRLAVEHFVAAGPAGAEPKCVELSFDAWWADLDQLAMAV